MNNSKPVGGPKKPGEKISPHDPENALQGQEVQFNAILAASPVPKFVIDKNHRVILWNRALENMTGIKAAEVLGTNLHWKAFYSEERPCLADLIVDGTSANIPLLYPYSYQRTDLVPGAYEVTDFFPFAGTRGKWLHFIAAPLIDDTGTVIGAVETLEDISTFIGIQQELRESEERYSALFSNSASVSLLIDPYTGLVVDANDAAVQYYGYPRDRLLGMGIYDLNRLPQKKVVQNLVRAKEEKAKHFQSVHYRADGEKRYVEIYSGPITVQGKALFYSIIHDITDRKQAEQALKESEERYSALFSNSASVSLLIDPDTGLIVDANDAAVQYYGYPRERLLGMGIYDLNRLPQKKVVQNLVRAKNEKAKHFHSTHYLEGGEKRYVEIYSGPITVQGKALFYSIIHDITDRKLAEEQLRESENKFSTVFQNSPVVLTLVSATDGKITDANDAFVRKSGYVREDVLGKTSEELGIFPHEHNYRERLFSALRDSQCIYGMEIKCRTKGGDIRDCLFSACLVLMGKKPYILSSIEDITDRKQAEQALKESEERYRTLIDQLPDYVIVHREGILLYVNPAGAANMSYDVKTLIGKSFFSVIAPESHDVTRQAVLRRMRGEDVPPYEIRIAARDGSLHTVLVHGALIQYEGAPASINVLTDITPIKEAEEIIRRANEDLEKKVLERTEDLRQANVQLTAEIAARAQAELEISRSLEEKVLLLREIHHRVKNNLQIITSLLKLQSRFIADPHVLEAIKDTQSRVRTMSLVHERIYRSPDIAEINLKDYLTFLVNQVAQFYNVQQHQIAISVTMPGIMVDIDTVTPLGLIMNELVSNSLKHAFPNNRKGSISIDCIALGADRLRIVYHDTGIGLPAGLDWKTSESLGLRLVNSLVDQLDGTIEFREGEGTTFIIDIRKTNARKSTTKRYLPGQGSPQEDLPEENGRTET